MMKREALANKVMLLGIDGMDPRLTRKYVDMGIMPNVKKLIDRGVARHDLMLLGGQPTVTPPMWTTLACGCNPNVHGITGFFRNGDTIGTQSYNIDSRLCKAEPLWNCMAEAGKKTLVWHWPGSSWPPTSDSENLMVVDGTSPGSVGMAVAQIEEELFVGASVDIQTLTYKEKGATDGHVVCAIADLEEEVGDYKDFASNVAMSKGLASKEELITCYAESGTTTTEDPTDLVLSPIKEASGWADASNGAKEFAILLSKGKIRRPALILKNENGVYDRIAIYKSKKDTEPLAVCPLGKMVVQVIDEGYKKEKKYEKCNRNFKLIKLDEDGSNLSLYVSAAMDATFDEVWHPKRLFTEVTENIGYPVPTSGLGCQSDTNITECMLANWEVAANWQADSILYLIEHEDLDVVFSHYHGVDYQDHKVIKHLADRDFNRNPVSTAEKWMENIYKQADRYIGKYLHLLDKGWTILLISDHGLVASKHDIPLLIGIVATCTPLMEQMGYTYLNRDENGKVLGIDWTKTTAVLQREGHIYLNIKGRDKHEVDGVEIDGLVDPKDQYEMEERIMTDLYNLKDPETGHRIVALALRNRDAVLLGMGGPESGDIICWHAEGYNYDHADALSTTWGEGSTSMSPVFIGAGKGLKQGVETDRIIREVDVAPTAAVLAGVRYPAQCEGAPAYQIFSEEI